MADWETLFGLARTDHLLPQKYSELLCDDWNLVLCCSICNSLKGGTDANLELPEDQSPDRGGRYRGGTHLTEQQHIALIGIWRQKLVKLRLEKQTLIETALASWNDL
jgi:hypothetical protein